MIWGCVFASGFAFDSTHRLLFRFVCFVQFMTALVAIPTACVALKVRVLQRV